MPRKNPYQDQAEANTLVRYGPEVSALTALLRQAEEDRDTALRQAKSGRQYSVGAVDQARPQIRQAYQGAEAAVTPAFANGGGIEAQALTARMGEAGALAQTQLANRRVSAIEGEQAARVQAQRNFTTDRGKIAARATDLARESGAFTATQIGDMFAADAKAQADVDQANAQNTQTERNAWIGAGVDPNTGTAIPGGRLDPKTNAKPNSGRGWATLEQQTGAKDEIDRLLAEARENRAAGETRGDTADLLTTGIPKGQRPVYKTVKIKNAAGQVTGTKQVRVLDPATGTQKTIDDPGFDAAKSQLLATAALDMAYDGHLSRRTQALLHARGIQLKPLGLVSFGEWLKTPEGQAWKAAQGANKTKQRSRPNNNRGSIRDIYG